MAYVQSKTFTGNGSASSFNFNNINFGKILSRMSAISDAYLGITTTQTGQIAIYANGKIGTQTTVSLYNRENWPVGIGTLAAYVTSGVNTLRGQVAVETDVVIITGSSFGTSSPAGPVGLTLTGTFKVPQISNIAVNRNDPRLPINITWQSDIQDSFILQAWQSGVKKYTTSGTTARTASIPINTLNPGAYDIKIVAANNPVDDFGIDATLTTGFVAAFNAPTVSGLEPNGINQNINQNIIASWSSTLQDSYILRLIQNSATIATYSGTTAKSLTIPASTFLSGTCDLELTASNIVNGVIASAVTTASFLGFGKPVLPVLSADYIYNTAKPLFAWTAPEQVAYQAEILLLDSVIESSGEILSTVGSYQTIMSLANNTEYSFRVKVKNQFGLWSDWSTKLFKISFTVMPKPNFSLAEDGNGGILVSVSMAITPLFNGCEIWKKDEFTPWTRLAVAIGYTGQWTDNTVASNKLYSYKVVATSTEGAESESDVKTISTHIDNFVFVDIENASRKIVLKWNPDLQFTRKRNRIVRTFAGASKPKIERDITNYVESAMNFVVNMEDYDKFTDIVDNAQVILFRDRRGQKIYGQISSDDSGQYVGRNAVELAFTFTEVGFIEKDIYSGYNLLRKLVFDGTWKFDGTQTFGGVRWD